MNKRQNGDLIMRIGKIDLKQDYMCYERIIETIAFWTCFPLFYLYFNLKSIYWRFILCIPVLFCQAIILVIGGIISLISVLIIQLLYGICYEGEIPNLCDNL